ncbi:MAG: hypothetical protein LIR50_21610 [Bacillota bacterium]|nr:hypothetical protein [Bacillota bacterium]
MTEVINIDSKGFKALKDYSSWRIAQLGYDEDVNSLDGVKTFGRHLKTDEVFTLLEGEASIFTAGFTKEFGTIRADKMEKNKIYIVKEKEWHAAVMNPGAKILIVENSDTCSSNSDIHELTQEEKIIMKHLRG